VENKSQPSLARAQWKSLLDKALFKTFFHTLEWEEFLEREFSWLRFERYVWRDELLISLARCRFLGREKLVSHPFCEYGGPLPLKVGIDWDGFSHDFQKFFGNKARIKIHPYLGTRGCFPADLRAVLAWSLPKAEQNCPSLGAPRWQGENEPENNPSFPSHSISAFWIEDFSKKTPEDLWYGFRKTLRKEIEKAKVAGITVAKCADRNNLKSFYDLYVATMKRHKNIPLPFSAFEFFQNRAEIYIVKKGDKVTGGSVFLFYPPFIHYFISASDYRLRELNIGYAILWHVMQKYAGSPPFAKGYGGAQLTPHIYDYFDLGGTRKGSALEVFKRGWGTKEYPIYEIGAENAARKTSFARDLWGMMPLVVLKRISKFALWLKA